MKNFKIIDFWISITLIIIFLVLSLIKLDYTFLIGYCVVGAWQVISMSIHSINKWFNQKGTRRYYYHWITFIVLLLVPITFYLGFFAWAFIILLYTMLFAAPFMAIYYTWLCYDEVYVKMQPPLALFK